MGAKPAARCEITPKAESNLTIAILDIAAVGVVGAALPGLDWQVDCEVHGNRFLRAQDDAQGRLVTVTVDSEQVGPLELATYASEQPETSQWSATTPGSCS